MYAPCGRLLQAQLLASPALHGSHPHSPSVPCWLLSALCSLGSEANVLRSQQRDIAAGHAARQAAKDAYKLSLERTAGFRALCSGVLGLWLWL